MLNVREWSKTIVFFFRKKLAVEVFIWIRRMYFSQPRRWTLDKMPKMNHSMSKIVEKIYDIFCLKKIVSQVLLKRRMLSTQPRRKIFEKRPKVLRSMSKSVWKTWIFSRKKQFSSECYYVYVDCIFHNLTNSFSLKAQKRFAQGPYW